MKKTILALLLTGGSFAVWAQDTTGKPPTDTTRRDSTDTSSRITSGNYNAYGSATNIPITVQQSFQNAYPDASDARWEQSNNMWRVNYKSNGQDMNMYYGANGQGYMIALPVLENQVPDEVVSKVKEMHGTNVYDITALRVNDSAEIYQVRIIENGELRTERINADGSAAAEITLDNSMNQNNGMNQMNDSTGNQMNNMNNNMNQHMNNNTGTDSTSNMSTDTTSGNNSTGTNMNGSTSDGTTNSGTTTDNMNATNTDANNSNNSGNTTTNTTGSEMNTTNPTNGKDGKLKIKSESSDGQETKVKVEKGEVKIKKD